MDVRSVLKVLDAFRRLDNIVVRFLVSPIKYPGGFHPISDIVRESGLSRSTVYRVLEGLVSLGVVERRLGFSLMYRLKEWEFDCCGLHYEVEVNRVVAYL